VTRRPGRRATRPTEKWKGLAHWDSYRGICWQCGVREDAEGIDLQEGEVDAEWKGSERGGRGAGESAGALSTPGVG